MILLIDITFILVTLKMATSPLPQLYIFIELSNLYELLKTNSTLYLADKALLIKVLPFLVEL